MLATLKFSNLAHYVGGSANSTTCGHVGTSPTLILHMPHKQRERERLPNSNPNERDYQTLNPMREREVDYQTLIPMRENTKP
jgi:hypothetical protein